ncbi:hypothetical protein N7457_006993 [Penicillium paradoxum]|uniref:uncharacterized protein n=1 Tax=Penicillium paradoxum TaxID=176176 RepID=UPI002549BB8A|nr:uncharacterized protein N7457_006993 [Penicillium paradoxum]KAJ5779273.1 hypothetical protein N7457_006993 [Penicillium paradoxum]
MADSTTTSSDTKDDTTKESVDSADSKVNDEKEKIKKEKKAKWKKDREAMPLKAEVVWLDYNHFKNRSTDEEGHAIIEVLRGHHALEREMRQEFSEREEREESDQRTKSKPYELKDGEETWAHRVRIQSPELLLLLSRLTGHGDSWESAGPRVFHRPFMAFYYTISQAKESLKILEERWAAFEANTGDENGTSLAGRRLPMRRRKGESSEVSQNLHFKTTAEATTGFIINSVTGLRHLRKYVEFIEGTIIPLWERAAGTSQRQVQFANLWMSFQIGELVYVPSTSENTTAKNRTGAINMPHQIWRVFVIANSEFETDPLYDIREGSDKQLGLRCYFIDFNGTSYEPYIAELCIPMFAGSKDITTLPVYPLRFHKNMDNILKKQRKLGESFADTLKVKYLYYDGWTLVHEPADDIEPDDESNGEYIDSQVIIDFAQGHKTNSDLAAKSTWSLTEWADSYWAEYEDTSMPIKHWDGENATELMAEVSEIVQKHENLSAMLCARQMDKSEFLRACVTGTATEIEPDDYVLLPRRVIGYSFRDRKFLRLNVELLKPIIKSEHVFRDLKIDPDHKRMIRAVIKAHFQEQKPGLDLIQGKGSGLVILLHGAPGVGKTATAEAVAQANNKPLFVITCGHLGFEPAEVEEKLREIFRLAHIWDCVLLLDEADVFLARRDLSDLKRNAVVSVFLRVLEYYSGILFLTTNRVGIIDEAFKSRIHISLHYTPLSKDQTLAIFETNLRKLQEAQEKHRQQPNKAETKQRAELKIDREGILEYAEWHYDNWPDHRWNGRQIRNAFQTAYSFAQFDLWNGSVDSWQNSPDDIDKLDDLASDDIEQDSGDRAQPVLDWRQFQLVADTVKRFDQYLTEAIGESEAEAASTWGLRADEHDPSQWNESPVYRPHSRKFERHDYGQSQRGSAQRRGAGRGSSVRNDWSRYSETLSTPSPTRSAHRERGRQNAPQRGGRGGTSRTFAPGRTFDTSKLPMRQEGARFERQPHGREAFGARDHGFAGEDEEDFTEGYDDSLEEGHVYRGQGPY